MLILALLFVYSVRALADVNTPARDPAIAVEIIGYQWWWEIRCVAAIGALLPTSGDVGQRLS